MLKIRCRSAWGSSFLKVGEVYTVVAIRSERWGIPSVRLAEIADAWYGLDRFVEVQP